MEVEERRCDIEVSKSLRREIPTELENREPCWCVVLHGSSLVHVMWVITDVGMHEDVQLATTSDNGYHPRHRAIDGYDLLLGMWSSRCGYYLGVSEAMRDTCGPAVGCLNPRAPPMC
jgi:hypothetical protein